MLKNYFLITLRNINNNKLFSVLNILGLTVGITICLLILCFVRYENSYDKQMLDADRIHRVTRHFEKDNMATAAIAAPFVVALETRFDDIEAATRIGIANEMPISRGDINITIENVLLAESDVFDVFQFEVLSGSKENALDRVDTVVLTESAARTFFGDEDPIGKTVLLNESQPIEVTAVIKDLPSNTHLNFSMLYTMETMWKWVPEERDGWDWNNFYTYIKLKEGVSPAILEGKLPTLMDELGEKVGDGQSLQLQALKDIHLHSNLMYEMKTNGSYIIIVSFSLIALVILLIACINYMNLSTARASKRAKEVGVRKAVGATRQQIIAQFLSESIFLTLIAVLLAMACVEITLPWFGSFVHKPLTASLLYSPTTLVMLVFSTLLVGCLAGSYPAFYLSSFPAAKVLKGESVHGGGAARFRRALVVAQFSISIALIICTVVVIKQTEYARNQDPGYAKDNNVVVSINYVPGFESLNAMYRTFRESLLMHPDILTVSVAQQLPTHALRDIWSYVKEEDNIVADNMVSIPTLNAGFGLFEHYQIPVVAGRTFSEDHGDAFVSMPTYDNPTGKGIAVVSQTAAKKLGYTAEEAVNKIIKIPFPPGSIHYTIVGVVEDIQFGSLKEEQKPQVYHLVSQTERYVSIQIAPEKVRESLRYIDETWSALVPNRPIKRYFLDESFNAMYNTEEKQAQIFALFAMLAIAVACLGLFGLATFTTERRKKEIGIRKVMGASVKDVVLLITNEFSVLVFVANLISWPIAYYLMHQWLDSFNAAISLNILFFLGAGVLAFAIAWTTVASQAAYSAMSKPVKSLRYE